MRGPAESEGVCRKSNDCYTKCGGFDKLNHRNATLLDSPRMKRAKKTSARFSAEKEPARVPEQVETCESTREKRTSVVTDGNEESEKNKCAVCAEKELARVPEQVKTCESTREKRTSVITDGNEESEKKLVRGLRGLETCAGMEGLPKARRNGT